MAKPKPIPLYLDDDQFAALGQFAAHWSYLESEIDFTITGMSFLALGDSTIPFPFDDRIKQWKRVLPQVIKSEYALRYYRGVVRLAKEAHDWRSKFLHARAIGDPKKLTRLISIEHHRHRNGDWFVLPIFIMPRKLRAMARTIGRATHYLIALNRRYLPAQPRALPNRYPVRPRDDPALPHQGRRRKKA
jgi:hypothetical protein